MRVVLDTNVFISGLKFDGRPASVLQMAAEGVYTLVLSEDMLLEIEDVLLRKFKWSTGNVRSTLNGLRTFVGIVNPAIEDSDCEDPDDNRILEAAIAGNATYIVSGDQHLLRMKRFRKVEIVNVNEFIDLLEREARKS
ncbi:MAG TPA: putative toxin-antitoxin system toxin component, PIN family [Edaphobacter sp.]